MIPIVDTGKSYASQFYDMSSQTSGDISEVLGLLANASNDYGGRYRGVSPAEVSKWNSSDWDDFARYALNQYGGRGVDFFEQVWPVVVGVGVATICHTVAFGGGVDVPQVTQAPITSGWGGSALIVTGKPAQKNRHHDHHTD